MTDPTPTPPPVVPAEPPAPITVVFGTVECVICKQTMDDHGSKDCHGRNIEGLKGMPLPEALARL